MSSWSQSISFFMFMCETFFIFLILPLFFWRFFSRQKIMVSSVCVFSFCFLLFCSFFSIVLIGYLKIWEWWGRVVFQDFLLIFVFLFLFCDILTLFFCNYLTKYNIKKWYCKLKQKMKYTKLFVWILKDVRPCDPVRFIQ